MILRSKEKGIYVLVFIMLIFFSSGSYIQIIRNYGFISIFLLAGLSYLNILCSYKFFKGNVKFLATIIFFIMIFQTFLTMGNGNIFLYTMYICLIITAYVVSEKVHIKDIATYLVNFMQITTIISLIGYYLVNYTTLTTSWPEIININNVVYKCIGIFTYIKVIPERNCAIFWEPGLFATYLIWALLADILILNSSKKEHILRFILFSLGIFSAHSTAGYALFLMVVILLLVYSQNTKQKIFMIVFSSIILIIAILCILNFDIILEIFDLNNDPFWSKLTSDKFFSETRFLSLAYNIEFFLENFLVGQGIENAYLSAKYVCDTSTSTFMLNAFGWMGSFYTIFWIYGIFRQKINLYSKIVVCFIVLSILNKEPHTLFSFSWIILYSILGNSIYKKGENKKNEIFSENKKSFSRWGK